MRAAELKRILEGLGFEWTTATGGGSHFKIKRDGMRTVPISLHHGLSDDVSEKLRRRLAKQLGIDATLIGCR